MATEMVELARCEEEELLGNWMIDMLLRVGHTRLYLILSVGRLFGSYCKKAPFLSKITALITGSSDQY